MKNFAFVLLFILGGCATTMPGDSIKTNSKHISAAVEEQTVFSDQRIQMYQFSMKNESNEWMEFDLPVISGSEGVSVLTGQRIDSWIEACILEKKVSDHNTAILVGSLAVAGLAFSNSSHQQTAGVGAAIALGSISAIAARDFLDSKKAAEFQNQFPEKHIFRPIVIPPGKVIQRWILVENPERHTFEIKMKNAKDEIVLKVGKDIVDVQPRVNKRLQ